MSEKDNNVMPLATDPHNLGEFDNVYDAMRRYPNGGVDGDYIYILGVQHFWNVNRQSWGILKDKEDNLVQMVEDFIGLFERRGYVFAGYALPDTTPVSGLDNIFYIAAKNGIYTHFGSDLKLLNEVAILRKPRRSSIWIKDSMDIPNSERIDVIDDAISRINVDIETIKSAIIGMENDLDGVHDSIDDINKDIDAFKKETSENFEEVNSDLDKVEKRLDYIPKESFLSARPAGFKPDIDLTPEIMVDRAWRDHEGNVIRDTYITRRGLRNEIIDITNQQVTDLKPGSVDPDDLSEATKQLIGNKSITNLPDEEDITVTDNRTLKLKDKEYAPKDYSGMGRVYLRKHYVNGVNTLTQHMMRKPNTIYIIQYDYCLAGQTIEVPENCVLQFEGGSLRNGVLIGSKTHVIGGIYPFNNILKKGKWDFANNLTVNYFSGNNDAERLQDAINFILDCEYEDINFPYLSIDRDIDLTGYTILLHKGSGEGQFPRKPIHIMGINNCHITKKDEGAMFMSDQYAFGDIYFSNLYVSGKDRDTNTIFLKCATNYSDKPEVQSTTIIRVHSTNNFFTNLGGVFIIDSDNPNFRKYMQSMRLIGDTYWSCGTVLKFPFMYDIKVANITCEGCHRFIHNIWSIYGSSDLVVRDSVIEGLTDAAITINYIRCCLIEGNYFEAAPICINIQRINDAGNILTIRNNTVGLGNNPENYPDYDKCCFIYGQYNSNQLLEISNNQISAPSKYDKPCYFTYLTGFLPKSRPLYNSNKLGDNIILSNCDLFHNKSNDWKSKSLDYCFTKQNISIGATSIEPLKSIKVKSKIFCGYIGIFGYYQSNNALGTIIKHFNQSDTYIGDASDFPYNNVVCCLGSVHHYFYITDPYNEDGVSTVYIVNTSPKTQMISVEIMNYMARNIETTYEINVDPPECEFTYDNVYEMNNAIEVGTAVQDLPMLPKNKHGMFLFNTNLDLPMLWSGNKKKWLGFDGFEFNRRVGTTYKRPTLTEIGVPYYDTTLNKPIWWNGNNWIDATGATV